MNSLVELRVLEGPNLYFPRAAIKLTLDVTTIVEASDETALRFARRIGLRSTRPGAPGSGFRQRFAMRAVERLVRAIAAESGTTRLAVRVRPTSDPDRLVVAFPWRHRGRAQSLGRAVADALDALPTPDLEAAVSAAAETVAAAEPGDGPTTLTPRVPVVAVTGTNGKTTTSRMIAHIARAHGLLTGWSNTDGIYIDGELVEAGDYSGPSGAGRVLAHPRVQLAVTETARGGILLKGIGLRHNDVSVVTNVTADHLGLQGIDTVDQLAEVKSVVPQITRKDGWAVLNADDPRVLAMRSVTKARPWVFSRDPDSPAIREVLGQRRPGHHRHRRVGHRAPPGRRPRAARRAGRRTHDPRRAVPLQRRELPRRRLGRAGRRPAAEAVVEGLRSFLPDAEHNPGRMNFFTLPVDGDHLSVVMDLAHNEAGLEALLEIMGGVRRPGARLLLGLGAVGDRTDELIDTLGEIGAKGSDVVAIGHKEHYLRGRTMDEIDQLLRAGAARVGVEDIDTHRTEVEALAALVAQARPGDVVGLMCHAEREEVYDWIAAHGGTPDTPEQLAAKVRAASV